MYKNVVFQRVKANVLLKGLAHFLTNIKKRNLQYITSSAEKTFAKAAGKSSKSSPGNIDDCFTKIQSGNHSDMTILYDVIATPLKKGQTTQFSGGLINNKTFTLVNEAIHSNGLPCQELQEVDVNELSDPRIPVIEHPVLYGGIMFNNFGHFLFESIGRLWAYECIKELDPYILFYAPYGQPKYFEKSNYVFQTLEGLGIPHKRMFFINRLVLIRRIIIPVQKYGYEICKSSDAIIKGFFRQFHFAPKLPKSFEVADKIYVSRAGLPAGTGKPVGETLFEKYLESNGYKSFYPELFTLYEQLNLYRRAEKIIFCDGGAIHSCILLPDLKADLAIIARRRDYRWNWGTNFREQFEGNEKSVLWIDEVQAQYQFGRETWNAMGVINWYEVSRTLFQHQFVNHLFEDKEVEKLINSCLPAYIQASISDPEFINYMANLKEHYEPI
jgi:hypothetical protein